MAQEQLKNLDRLMAVQRGIADKVILGDVAPALSLKEGRTLYTQSRPASPCGGRPKPVSAKRYRAIFDKFVTFAAQEKVTSWNQVNRRVLEKYAAHLDGDGYAYATEYLELTTLKQVIKWLVAEKHLPASCAIYLRVAKPTGTTTYRWRPEEVRAMLEYCAARPDRAGIGEIITSPACTGLRISELASLRWSDIDIAKNLITLTDESTRRRRSNEARRETKSGRDRCFPIHEELRKILIKKHRAADGLVFHGIQGGRVKPDTIRNSLIRHVLKPLSDRFPKTGRIEGFMDGRLHS